MTAPSMSLVQLLCGTDGTPAMNICIGGLTLDSRQVQSGDAFVALAGLCTHGQAHAPQAVQRGAVAILVDAQDDAVQADHLESVPVVRVRNLATRLGPLAARLYADPSRDMHVIAVTGTNGKTSVVHLLAQALSVCGQHVATIGTLGSGLHGHVVPGQLTTPDAIQLQRALADFRDADVSHVAMEASSHALDQGRLDALHVDLAIHTNLSRDHLDYHRTMQAYGAAKSKLFERPGLRRAIINIDDVFGRQLAAPLSQGLLLTTGSHVDADVRAQGIVLDADGLRFDLHTPWGDATIRSGLLGRFSVDNLLAVSAALGELGVPFARIATVLAQLQPVPGRMNRVGGVGGAGKPLVVVDYSHTPDALQQALQSLQAHGVRRLGCVFGCGGERDAGKRPQMGAVAQRLADWVVVTDDNPRNEDGDAIVAQISAGFVGMDNITIERDRAAAIALAINQAGSGDAVLVAGKGHETTQDIGGALRPFDDLAVARAALQVSA